jgi:hypothetical protein
MEAPWWKFWKRLPSVSARLGVKMGTYYDPHLAPNSDSRNCASAATGQDRVLRGVSDPARRFAVRRRMSTHGQSSPGTEPPGPRCVLFMARAISVARQVAAQRDTPAQPPNCFAQEPSSWL